MKSTAALWRTAARAPSPLRQRASHPEVKKFLRLSDEQWSLFMRVSQNVCEEHAGYKLSEIPSVERIRMRRQIQTTIREVGLPALDDDAIEWRISKCMPELRVKMRDIKHCHNWEAATRTEFPRQLLREAVLAHSDQIPKENLRYWSHIPEDVRRDIIDDANRRLAEKGMPEVDSKALLYRIRKYMNHWIKKGFVQKPKDRRGSD
ncbi:hypothetical protein ACJQWK_03862 [Exserohilum turcicum]|uniref:Uncharacterized protein n=1 Tax=Exserohilum turcicum (strain 28A) TaxID=671987 RepID=R0KG72_EXST2|nr:uncharacterized protein SETTUDRAFT_152889 [Exserohilum turcica Et28A]EOA91853.1 hypothetical protein SETTUDRAFT_152889 [Exserohilum turcica Et28A]